MSLYQNVKIRCIEKNVKIGNIEARAGLVPSTISRWTDDGPVPSVATVKRVADLLEVSVDELLEGTSFKH